MAKRTTGIPCRLRWVFRHAVVGADGSAAKQIRPNCVRATFNEVISSSDPGLWSDAEWDEIQKKQLSI